MKKLLIKIPGIIALCMSIVSLVWYVMYLFELSHDEIWNLSVIMAMFSMPFFLIDAVISFVKAIKKDDPKFNYILALVLVGALPMVLFLGGDGRDHINGIWNVYYVMVVALEVISIKKAWVAMKADNANKANNPD